MDEYKFETVVVKNQADANEVIRAIAATIKHRNYATVGDLYNLVAISPVYADDKHGWTAKHIPEFKLKSASGGFLLDFPTPEPID